MEEVEGILSKKFKNDAEGAALKFFEDVMEFVKTVQRPSGYKGKVIGAILKKASEELYPLAAALASFQLGVAWEKYQNAERASGEP